MDIRRISLDTPDLTDVVAPVSGLRHAVAIDFDPVNKFVYWSDDEMLEIKKSKWMEQVFAHYFVIVWPSMHFVVEQI